MIEDITFLGQTLETAPCFREDILSVAETVAMSDPSVMEMVVCELDSSSQFYSETTARELPPIEPYVIDVRAGIASIVETRSAGCALIARADSVDNVPFCEIGRNYRYYQQQLGAVHPVVVGFATVKASALEARNADYSNESHRPLLEGQGGFMMGTT